MRKISCLRKLGFSIRFFVASSVHSFRLSCIYRARDYSSRCLSVQFSSKVLTNLLHVLAPVFEVIKPEDYSHFFISLPLLYHFPDSNASCSVLSYVAHFFLNYQVNLGFPYFHAMKASILDVVMILPYD